MLLPNLTRKNLAFVLLLFLSVQLTGLSCIQDLWVVFSGDKDSTAEMTSIDAFPSQKPSGSTSIPAEETLNHDCPCHYTMTYLSNITLASAQYNGTLAIPGGQRVDDHLPQVIFHPPLVLS